MVKVECILESGYNDTELNEKIEKGRIYYVSDERAEFLKSKNAIKILKEEEQEEKPKRKSRRML